MKKQLLIIGIIFLLIAVGLSGCNSTAQEKIIGKWQSSYGDNIFTNTTFFKNGSVSAISTGETNTSWSSYTITDKLLTITPDKINYEYEYFFSSDNQKLALIRVGTTRDTIILERQ